MKKSRQKKLEGAGWKVGGAKEFLGLSEEEIRLIETKRSLIRMIREIRKSADITQKELAAMINSSQSRVAKMEAASPDVSLDLIFRSLFALGISQKKLGRVISQL